MCILRMGNFDAVSRMVKMKEIDGSVSMAGIIMVGAVVLMPLTFVLAYTVMLVGVPILALGCAGILAYTGAAKAGDFYKAFQKQSAEEAKLLGVYGVGNATIVGTLYRERMRDLVCASSGGCSTGCSCIKAKNGGYAGVIRLKNDEGSFYTCFEGKTKVETITYGLQQINEFMNQFPVVPGQEVKETEVCNSSVCPLGGPLKAYAVAA